MNGVKQGAIISPILFCVYLDTLLVRLKEAGVGCYFGSYFVGALAYADDVALLAPSANADELYKQFYKGEFCSAPPYLWAVPAEAETIPTMFDMYANNIRRYVANM